MVATQFLSCMWMTPAGVFVRNFFLIHAFAGVSWTTLVDVGSVLSIFFLLLFRALRSAIL